MTVVPASERQRRGDAAERLAERHLRRAGLTVAARNFRSRFGEIDLVMRDGDTLVFVEVRRRRPGRWGTATDSVGPHKRRRLILAAQRYLQRFADPPPCRFDVVGLDEQRDGQLQVRWLRDAFRADG